MPMQVKVDYAAKAQKPEPAGWTAVWAATIDLFVRTIDLQAEGT